MNETLHDAFRHNSWATKQLLAACRGLSTEQLTLPAGESFGSILATFNHLILSDAGYVRRFAKSVPAWWVTRDESSDLDQLAMRVDETAQLWEQVLAVPLDAEQVIIMDEGTYEAHAGVVIAQALHHGNAHREQICAMLTRFGLEPPDVQVWAYAEATGRGRERRAED
jgi:uncharacterized damage-inducible protein DinB